jgi:hypothetical protein
MCMLTPVSTQIQLSHKDWPCRTAVLKDRTGLLATSSQPMMHYKLTGATPQTQVHCLPALAGCKNAVISNI